MPGAYKRPMKAWPDQRRSWWRRWLNNTPSQAVTYFAHIPKTAGTSFIVLLDRFFPAEKIYPKQLWREAGKVTVTDHLDYDLFRGHFGGGGVQVLTERPIDYLTILRDPNTLAVSTYQFVQREQNTKVHQLVNEQQMSFADFLQHPVTSVLVKNRMIRNISFDFASDPAAQEVFLSAETIAYLQDIIKQQGEPKTDAQRLVRAESFIHTCKWFGLLERFDESMQLLCFVMHWPPIGVTQKLNTKPQSVMLTAEEEAVLTAVNHEDLALYDLACQLFAEQYQHMLTRLDVLRSSEQQTVDDLLDLRYQQHQAQQLRGQLPIGLYYDFGQVLLGSQWHRRELMQPENEYFRWTGPGPDASIDFWLQPKNYQLQIRIINATSVELLNELQVKVNGHELAWQSVDDGVVRVLHMCCPAAFIKTNGLVRLSLHCNDMNSHQLAFDSDDERLVGVAVHWIQFTHEH